VTEPGRCLVIAEAGVNHNGHVALAHRLVDAAADCGADLVKFQTFDPVALSSRVAPTAGYQAAEGAATQHELLADLCLSDDVWSELATHARDREIGFISTAFDERSLGIVDRLGVPLFKVPSGEITNLPFIQSTAAIGKPLILSTGMATMDEVARALDAASTAPSVTLLHCVSSYPASVEEANLRAMVSMRDRFGVPVGWSDHTVGAITALGAVALGATVLEKHLTLDRTMPGPDHRASADPDDFAEYVRSIRALESALGDGLKQPTPDELEMRTIARRSWHVVNALPAGHRIRSADVVALRPATGIGPDVDVNGRVLARDVAAGAVLVEDDLA
jgi:N-acetylneuraminate synthase/N,N'-diacetyllegionaminate synthase